MALPLGCQRRRHEVARGVGSVTLGHVVRKGTVPTCIGGPFQVERKTQRFGRPVTIPSMFGVAGFVVAGGLLISVF